MSKLLKILNWLILGITTAAAVIAGSIIFQLQSGTLDGPGAGFTLLFLIAWLAIFGLISLILGFLGYFKARTDKTMTPLVHTLGMVIGALALLMGLYFGAY